ncbi:hypothetical protein M8S55_24365, partial [Enterobacter hormaechei]|nr:hypothetical protein [Enterobacter hormaechei]MCM7663488.1 hypothetical protein [Enterobacter hormaechei]
MQLEFFCFIFYPTAFAYACYKKRWLEWIFLTLIIIFASAISIQQYNEANFVSELNWHCCKVSDEAAFCLIQRPYISKTLLT